ncbi:MAG TPA: CDGSH iron-sulfur domain-containing protein [Fibrobacteria bacterium]|jgi:CDGSH-type Zn-finger protein|nr:CDGSH iron-sulfur domain-containing protein [Fibrobacteria bacterium]
MSIKITALKHGPLQVEAGAQICDAAGQVFTVTEGKPVFLCRCGQSANKPFCDGAHRKAEFQSEVSAK